MQLLQGINKVALKILGLAVFIECNSYKANQAKKKVVYNESQSVYNSVLEREASAIINHRLSN